MGDLTARQAAFVQEYLIDLNGTQAAIRAGYSQRTANEQAVRLLANVSVGAAVAAGKAARAKRTELTADRVIKELEKLAFSNMYDLLGRTADGDPFIDLSSLTRDQAAALQSVAVEDYVEGRGPDAREVKRVTVKLADKRAALVDLGKHLGIFKDNNTAVAIVVNILGDDANL